MKKKKKEKVREILVFQILVMNTFSYTMHKYKNMYNIIVVFQNRFIFHFQNASCSTISIVERQNYSHLREELVLILKVRQKKIQMRVYSIGPGLHETWYQTLQKKENEVQGVF